MRNSKIILCSNILLDKEYRNVLNYTENTMLSLVNSKKVAEDNHYSFIRETGTILVEFTYQTCLSANYIAYQNPDYSNKWFFAWTDKVSYKNDHTTEISFIIDVWSTWFSSTNRKKCFVLREHVSDDTIGAHTIPENLQTGDYRTRRLVEVSELKNCKAVLSSTTNPNNVSDEGGGIYQNIPTGARYYAYDLSLGSDWIDEGVQNLTNEGKKSSIVGLFLAPAILTGTSTDGQAITNSYSPTKLRYKINQITSIGAYTPKNKKVLTYPYCYHLLTNGAGGSAIFKPELWNDYEESGTIDDGAPGIEIAMALTPGCSITAYPMNYDGDVESIENSLPLGKYPTLNYSVDLYTNWCTENALNISFAYLNGATSVVGGFASLAQAETSNDIMSGSAQVGSGAQTIANAIYSNYLADRVPPQLAGNTNCGDVNYSNEKITYRILSQTIREEYARTIDEYFSKYGYKINRLKLPNISGRKAWNYIQIGNNEQWIYGGIPTQYIDAINNIAINGTTIWHNHDNIGNYDLDNTNA